MGCFLFVLFFTLYITNIRHILPTGTGVIRFLRAYAPAISSLRNHIQAFRSSGVCRTEEYEQIFVYNQTFILPENSRSRAGMVSLEER